MMERTYNIELTEDEINLLLLGLLDSWSDYDSWGRQTTGFEPHDLYIKLKKLIGEVA